jgi:hypothetical protein
MQRQTPESLWVCKYNPESFFLHGVVLCLRVFINLLTRASQKLAFKIFFEECGQVSIDGAFRHLVFVSLVSICLPGSGPRAGPLEMGLPCTALAL